MADTIEQALTHLRARQWAGPDSHPNIERFLMSEARKHNARRPWLKLTMIVALAGLSVSAAAIGVSQFVLRKPDGTSQPVTIIGNAKGAMGILSPDGKVTPAYPLPRKRPMRMSDMTPQELADLKTEMQAHQGEAMFAKVGGVVVSPSGQEVAVTHDLTGPKPPKLPPLDDDKNPAPAPKK